VDRFTWSIVVGAVLLVGVALASVTFLQHPTATPDLSTPDGVVRAYITAINTQHPEQAWDLLTTGARAGVTRDEFVRRVSSEGGRRAARVAIESTVVEGSDARVDVSRTFEDSGLFGETGYVDRTTVRLKREDGAWRIDVPPDPYLLNRLPPPAVVTTVVTVVATPAGTSAVTPAGTPTPRAP
jgi:hypothetical protein